MLPIAARGRKPAQYRILRWRKMRRFSQNQVKHGNQQFQNVHNSKISLVFDFNSKTLTHMDATHAISKLKQKIRNRNPRESRQNFYIPRISKSYLFIFTFLPEIFWW